MIALWCDDDESVDDVDIDNNDNNRTGFEMSMCACDWVHIVIAPSPSLRRVTAITAIKSGMTCNPTVWHSGNIYARTAARGSLPRLAMP